MDKVKSKKSQKRKSDATTNPQLVPVYRASFTTAQGASTDITPASQYHGVVAVESDGPDPKTNGTRIKIIAYANDGETVNYTNNSSDYWVVDLPTRNEIDLTAILTAIVNGKPTKPSPPIT